MTNAERQSLWNQYPEVQEMFEEFNGILLEADNDWEWLVIKCHEIADIYSGNKAVELSLSDAAYQLELLAKKRSGILKEIGGENDDRDN